MARTNNIELYEDQLATILDILKRGDVVRRRGESEQESLVSKIISIERSGNGNLRIAYIRQRTGCFYFKSNGDPFQSIEMEIGVKGEFFRDNIRVMEAPTPLAISCGGTLSDTYSSMANPFLQLLKGGPALSRIASYLGPGSKRLSKATKIQTTVTLPSTRPDGLLTGEVSPNVVNFKGAPWLRDDDIKNLAVKYPNLQTRDLSNCPSITDEAANELFKNDHMLKSIWGKEVKI